MSDVVLVAIIGGACSLLGTFGGVVVSQNVTNFRLEQLERAGALHIGVYGVAGDARKPTIWCQIGYVQSGAKPTVSADERTPSDAYTALMGKATAAQTAAEQARDVTVAAATDAIAQAHQVLENTRMSVETASNYAQNAQNCAQDVEKAETRIGVVAQEVADNAAQVDINTATVAKNTKAVQEMTNDMYYTQIAPTLGTFYDAIILETPHISQLSEVE